MSTQDVTCLMWRGEISEISEGEGMENFMGEGGRKKYPFPN